MAKVDIISGFLGAGKTTFIKELISKAYKDEKTVLIENEFGEIGIDSRFMQNSGIEVTEMNSGCICCTLVGDFAKSLKQVSDEFHPDRIIIEPSGVGKLSDVAKAVIDMQDEAGVEIESLITVADGKKAKMYMKNFGEFYNDQLEHAGVIVISRTQDMDEKALAECVELLREKNHDAAIITTPWEDLSGDMINAALSHSHALEKVLHELEHEQHGEHHHHEHEHHRDHEHHDHDENHHHDHHHDHDDECCCDHDHHHHEHDHDEHDHHHDHDDECCCGHDHEHDEHHHHEEHHHHHHDHEDECGCGCGHDHHHDHHADEIFTSWGIETVHKFSRAELEDTLSLMGVTKNFGTVLRAKGIVESDDGTWMEFDMVPEELEIRECQPDYIGRVCVIGTELDEEALKRVFVIS